MKINITDEIRNSKSLAGHLVLHGLSEILSTKELNKFCDDNEVSDGDSYEGVVVDIALVVNGMELPFLEFCKEWDSQLDRMIRDEAKEMIADKLSDIQRLILDLSERLEPEIEKRLEDWEKEK